MSSAYQQLIERKLAMTAPTGLMYVPDLSSSLFQHQEALTNWSLRRGRAAIFADTGLGKTRMELSWSKAVVDVCKHDVMMLAPLAVAAQTVKEGEAIGIDVNLCRDDSDVRPGINITNYDRLHKFDTRRVNGVVLDESSCIKHHDSKTLQTLMDAFAHAPFKLCATATPAPNDWTELGTHAEFLGICTRAEMLSEYFVHDGAETQVWRLKGHARQQFWRWVSSWGAMIRSPADLGFDDSAYRLTPLHFHEHIVQSTRPNAGELFIKEAQTLGERRDARRASINERVAECAKVVNAEGDALTAAIDGAVQIAGADTTDEKEARLNAFAAGEIRVLVSKPSICGWGLNWQHSARMAFVGVTDSYEATYQAIRRQYRFGQRRDVHVHLFASEAEGAVLSNLRRKERDAAAMADALSAETRDAVRANVTGVIRQSNPYDATNRINVPNWLRTESV
jgi:hypothetical protein